MPGLGLCGGEVDDVAAAVANEGEFRASDRDARLRDLELLRRDPAVPHLARLVVLTIVEGSGVGQQAGERQSGLYEGLVLDSVVGDRGLGELRRGVGGLVSLLSLGELGFHVQLNARLVSEDSVGLADLCPHLLLGQRVAVLSEAVVVGTDSIVETRADGEDSGGDANEGEKLLGSCVHE